MQNYTKLRALKQPNLIHKLSNAPRHIIQQMVRAYHTTANEMERETEKEKVLIPYSSCAIMPGTCLISECLAG
jgi:hypothetical protein